MATPTAAPPVEAATATPTTEDSGQTSAPGKPGAAASPPATQVAETSNPALRRPGSEPEPIPEKVTPIPENEPSTGQIDAQILQMVSGAVTSGPIHTWQDGEYTRRVRLVSGLLVQPTGSNTEADTVVAASGGSSIVIRQGGHTTEDSEPVFVSEVGGGLMTLPGGVLLVLDPEWGESRINRFFSENGIKRSRVSPRAFHDNAFFVETEPGLPSLELANKLAAQEGVLISSPNWARQVELR